MTNHVSKSPDQIQEGIAAYNLKQELYDRLQIKIVGGVAQSTIYKAYRVGGTTPTLRLILDTAKELIAEHEIEVKEKIEMQLTN